MARIRSIIWHAVRMFTPFLCWVWPAFVDGAHRSVKASPVRFPVFRLSEEERPANQQHRRHLAEHTFSRTVPVYGEHDKIGYFYSNLHIGTPAQRFGVILDTGSIIISVPCENCTHCGKHLDPVFNVTASSTAVDLGEAFKQRYTEGSSLFGKYIEDLMCIGDCEDDVERVRFKFGCANSMTNLFRTQLADGIMGMANVNNTLIHYLMDHHRVDDRVFTMCLSYSGGTFGVGEFETLPHWSPMLWAPLATKVKRSLFYYVELTAVTVDGVDVGASDADVKLGQGGFFIDSGTTYTYVPTALWKKIKAQFDAFCDESDARCNATKAVHDKKSVGCYRGFHDHDTMHTFPSISFTIQGQSLCYPPHQYMFYERGYTCVGLIQSGSGFVFGSNLMMDLEIVFDFDQNRVGFARSPCHEEREIPWCCKGHCHHPETGDESEGQKEPYHYKQFEHPVKHRVKREKRENVPPAPPPAPSPRKPDNDSTTEQ